MFNSFSPPLEGQPADQAGAGGGAKAIANWMLGPVKSWMNEHNKEINEFPLTPLAIASLIELVSSSKVSFTAASTKIFPGLLANPEKDPGQLAVEMNLMQVSDISSLEILIGRVLEKYPEKVNEYKKGKKGLLSLFVGEVMKASKGKADPKITNDLLTEKLKS